MTLSNLSNTLEQIKVAQASDAALRQQLGSILAHATGADGGVGAEDAERLAEIVNRLGIASEDIQAGAALIRQIATAREELSGLNTELEEAKAELDQRQRIADALAVEEADRIALFGSLAGLVVSQPDDTALAVRFLRNRGWREMPSGWENPSIGAFGYFVLSVAVKRQADHDLAGVLPLVDKLKTTRCIMEEDLAAIERKRAEEAERHRQQQEQQVQAAAAAEEAEKKARRVAQLRAASPALAGLSDAQVLQIADAALQPA